MTSIVDKTYVDIKLPLDITTEDGKGDVTVTETLKSTESTSGESHASAKWNTLPEKLENGIIGSVFGGGDMGQVGSGYINASTNTAVIESEGKTNVVVTSGYIGGSVFGGGNGQPDEGQNYTHYMGTVFGTSNTEILGGYVEGSVFGCGQQSRTYSGDDGAASNVKITGKENPIVIGGSIFGGGNKGSSNTQNASVATVYGSTYVELSGEEGEYTPIYMLSTENSGGGVYGDGNLCLVSGKKTVVINNFSCGRHEDGDMLKTFYSLQRADEVTLSGSRVVLLGAVDLVAENADDTVYSINRVGKLNLENSSTIKVVKTVNLLAELTSDEQTDRQFIDRGNNNGNYGISGNDYTGHGGSDPKSPLTEDEVNDYINAYDSLVARNTVSCSVNVVCVANGGYLEVKKSETEYGPVTGLYTLQLVNAVPGEGGGFVYASIMGKQVGDGYATGNFICMTKDSSGEAYMQVFHDVGGSYTDGKYEYYIWYLKGNKYNYDVDLTAYIGTLDTDFSKTLSVSADQKQKYVLLGLEQNQSVNGFDSSMLMNTWENNEEDKSSDKIAIELRLIINERNGSSIAVTTQNIGFIGYETVNGNPDGDAVETSGSRVYGIWRSTDSGWEFKAPKGDDKSFEILDGDALAELGENTVGVQLQFILHKGEGMVSEFRNLPFVIKIAEVAENNYTNVQADNCIMLTTNLKVSAIRLVPTQAAYLGVGKLYGGISSDAAVNITGDSAFTMQFITKYIPSAFTNGSTNRIEETLKTKYETVYLLDENGVGYTLNGSSLEPVNVVNQNDNTVHGYKIALSGDEYTVTYLGSDGNVLVDEDGKERTYSCTAQKYESGFVMPAGTTITLSASIDEGSPSYWYYYCTADTGEVKLGDFIPMNAVGSASGDIYNVINTASSSRITENLIFVIDFSNASDLSGLNEASIGSAFLEHSYKSAGGTSDIMDYVSAENKSEESVSYTREMPKQTGVFTINTTTDGITSFGVYNDDTTLSSGSYKFRLVVTPDDSATNTRYEERQFAVILKLKSGDGEIPFPEGTDFTYKGKHLTLGAGNRYVIIPIETVGTHNVEMSTTLVDFEAGSYTLEGYLFSTSANGYYNSISIEHSGAYTKEAVFSVAERQKYAVKVEEIGGRDMNHIASPGESFNFEITTNAGGDVSVSLYRMEGDTFVKTDLSNVLSPTPSISGTSAVWNPTVSGKAQIGTYRLEFKYFDRTEYWDFIVVPKA